MMLFILALVVDVEVTMTNTSFLVVYQSIY